MASAADAHSTRFGAKIDARSPGAKTSAKKPATAFTSAANSP
jgi:hypothetical protein